MKEKIDKIDSIWLKQAMLSKGIKLSRLVDDTGLDKEYLASFMHGDREMTSVMKVMFFYYFKSLK